MSRAILDRGITARNGAGNLRVNRRGGQVRS